MSLGRGQHKEGCACVFCQRCRAKSLDPSARGASPAPATESIEAAPEPPRVKRVLDAKDPFDKKLDHFQYTLDPKEAAIWEHDETISPLHVSRELKRKYPDLEWRWVSEYKLKTKGEGYNGWQLFRDSDHTTGIRRGNDLRLAAMPKEMAESYRRAVSERSSRSVSGAQESAVANLESRMGGIAGAEMMQPGEEFTDRQTGQRRTMDGLTVGARPSVGRGGSYQRGLSREQAHEMIIKRIEARKKNKVYAFMGK